MNEIHHFEIVLFYFFSITFAKLES